MFGKRTIDAAAAQRALPAVKEASAVAKAMPVSKPVEAKGVPVDARAPAAARPEQALVQERRHSEEYYDVKTTVFNALIDTIDLTQLPSWRRPLRARRSGTSSPRSSRSRMS